MNDNRPNLTIIYQDSQPSQPPMGCFELALSIVFIVFFCLILIFII